MMVQSIHHIAQVMQAASPVTSAAAAAAAIGTGSTSGTTGTSSTTSSNNQLDGNSFITLLTAQLQAQDPFNPVDPTTFMNELVQFNSLQQLIDINTQLSALTGPGASGSSGSATSSSNAVTTNPSATSMAAGNANLVSAAAAAGAAASGAAASPVNVPALFSNPGAIVANTGTVAPGGVAALHTKDSGINSNPNLALWSSQPSN